MHDFISQMTAFIAFYEGKLCSRSSDTHYNNDVSNFNTNTNV